MAGEAKVRRLWAETPWLTGAVLEVAPGSAETYRIPGQYLVLKPKPDSKVFLAIASAPGEAQAFELLLGEAAREKLGLSEGGSIAYEGPSGPGFPLAPAAGKDVLLFAMGSGLSALRPVVETIRRNRGGFGRVVLYAGAHSDTHHAYRGHDDAWAKDEIEIRRANSRPWVQELYASDPVPAHNAVAYVSGSKPMVQAVKDALGTAGMPADRVYLNF